MRAMPTQSEGPECASARCAGSMRRRNRPNRSMTKPNPITAKHVRLQASKDLSAARNTRGSYALPIVRLSTMPMAMRPAGLAARSPGQAIITPTSITAIDTQGTESVQFSYGSDRQRWMQNYDSGAGTTVYIGGLL